MRNASKIFHLPAARTPSSAGFQLSTLCPGLWVLERCLLHCSRRRCHYYPAAVIMHQVSLSLSRSHWASHLPSPGYKWANAFPLVFSVFTEFVFFFLVLFLFIFSQKRCAWKTLHIIIKWMLAVSESLAPWLMQ